MIRVVDTRPGKTLGQDSVQTVHQEDVESLRSLLIGSDTESVLLFRGRRFTAADVDFLADATRSFDQPTVFLVSPKPAEVLPQMKPTRPVQRLSAPEQPRVQAVPQAAPQPRLQAVGGILQRILDWLNLEGDIPRLFRFVVLLYVFYADAELFFIFAFIFLYFLYVVPAKSNRV